MIEFLNNFTNIIQENTNLERLDKILKNIALNLTVDDRKILKLALKEPFNEFMELKKDPKVLIGGSVENQVESLKLYYFITNNSEKIIDSARRLEDILLETEKPQAFVVTL